MARKRKTREPEWPGETRGYRTPPPSWANDVLGEPLGRNERRAGWPLREALLADAMDRALQGEDAGELRSVLKQVVTHEVARIEAGPPGYILHDEEMRHPATAELALALLDLTACDADGRLLLRRWAVDLALARHPGRQRRHSGLGGYIEGPWQEPTVAEVEFNAWY